MYRKPTTTNITIHANSYHLYFQKIAAFDIFVHKMLPVLLGQNRLEETNIFKSVAIEFYKQDITAMSE